MLSLHLKLWEYSYDLDKKLSLKDIKDILEKENAAVCIKMKIWLRFIRGYQYEDCPKLVDALYDLDPKPELIDINLISCLAIKSVKSRIEALKLFHTKCLSRDIEDSFISKIEEFFTKSVIEYESLISDFERSNSQLSELGLDENKLAIICKNAVIEHNLIVLSKFYETIKLERLSSACLMDQSDSINSLTELVRKGDIDARINLKDSVIRFLGTGLGEVKSATLEQSRHSIRKELASSIQI